MKKSLAILLLVVVMQCWLAGTAIAQQQKSNCDSSTVAGFVPGGVPAGYGCTDWGLFTFLFICNYKNVNCAPPTSPTEVHAKCPWCSNPVDLTTGNTYIEQTDVNIPGLSNLTLVRTWNSQWPSSQRGSVVGLFGPHWRSTYEERVFLDEDGYLRYARSDGSFWSFGLGDGLGWAVVAPGNAGATAFQRYAPQSLTPTYWDVVLKNGEVRRFDYNSGSLFAIFDRNGHGTSVTYDSANRLVSVTDSVSRTLTFTYANNNSFLVTGVSSSVGVSLTYAYDSQNRLSQVTKPDQTTLTFQYDSNSNITAVLDANGKVLESHTYDAGNRSLTSSRANGVEAVTISY
jgi:YD repeat-containing protein